MQALSKAEAQALVSEAAYTTGDAPETRRFGDPEPPATETGEARTVIHTITGMLRGADWDLTDALAFIQSADDVGWDRHIVGHDLSAIKDGQRVRFDVRRT